MIPVLQADLFKIIIGHPRPGLRHPFAFEQLSSFLPGKRPIHEPCFLKCVKNGNNPLCGTSLGACLAKIEAPSFTMLENLAAGQFAGPRARKIGTEEKIKGVFPVNMLALGRQPIAANATGEKRACEKMRLHLAAECPPLGVLDLCLSFLWRRAHLGARINRNDRFLIRGLTQHAPHMVK